MRLKFDQQLEELNRELIKMGALCERAIRLAVDQLMKAEAQKAKEVNQIEMEINHKERGIEALCIPILYKLYLV